MTAIEHLGPTELTLIATSTKGWLINLLVRLKPPKPPDLSPEAMKKAGKIIIANPILGRLNSDPDALTKTKCLTDSYSDRRARELSATFIQHGTWQCPTLIRDAMMRLGDHPMYTQVQTSGMWMRPSVPSGTASQRCSRRRSRSPVVTPSGDWVRWS